MKSVFCLTAIVTILFTGYANADIPESVICPSSTEINHAAYRLEVKDHSHGRYLLQSETSEPSNNPFTITLVLPSNRVGEGQAPIGVGQDYLMSFNRVEYSGSALGLDACVYKGSLDSVLNNNYPDDASIVATRPTNNSN
ncbi:hypothetical protein M9194_07610 [Vibrio sp. S4M6]|uniref:hypothetical protein n=1 Tax=Vibrio sinus TaxID=2946865 RepID=UPI00202A295B|nr:hypothetical protein [Vibrio sinus]MCL9781294.1 hypothetical protein [Vibrio sinus]